MSCREGSQCQGPGAGTDVAGLVRAERQEVKLKRRPSTWGPMGVRVRVGAFRGSEQNSHMTQLTYGEDPSGCHVRDGLQGPWAEAGHQMGGDGGLDKSRI